MEIPSKIIIIIREDLLWDYKRITTLVSNAISSLSICEFEKWKSSKKIDIYTIFNLHFLDKKELDIINLGYSFEWLYRAKTPEAIMIKPNQIFFKPDFLEDCMSIEEYSHCRLELYNTSIIEEEN
jgi:hypothetical protein